MSSRMLKELKSLAPWQWDSAVTRHPPGAASLRDFEKLESSIINPTSGKTRQSEQNSLKGSETPSALSSQKASSVPSTTFKDGTPSTIQGSRRSAGSGVRSKSQLKRKADTTPLPSSTGPSKLPCRLLDTDTKPSGGRPPLCHLFAGTPSAKGASTPRQHSATNVNSGADRTGSVACGPAPLQHTPSASLHVSCTPAGGAAAAATAGQGTPSTAQCRPSQLNRVPEREMSATPSMAAALALIDLGGMPAQPPPPPGPTNGGHSPNSAVCQARQGRDECVFSKPAGDRNALTSPAPTSTGVATTGVALVSFSSPATRPLGKMRERRGEGVQESPAQVTKGSCASSGQMFALPAEPSTAAMQPAAAVPDGVTANSGGSGASAADVIPIDTLSSLRSKKEEAVAGRKAHESSGQEMEEGRVQQAAAGGQGPPGLGAASPLVRAQSAKQLSRLGKSNRASEGASAPVGAAACQAGAEVVEPERRQQQQQRLPFPTLGRSSKSQQPRTMADVGAQALGPATVAVTAAPDQRKLTQQPAATALFQNKANKARGYKQSAFRAAPAADAPGDGLDVEMAGADCEAEAAQNEGAPACAQPGQSEDVDMMEVDGAQGVAGLPHFPKLPAIMTRAASRAAAVATDTTGRGGGEGGEPRPRTSLSGTPPMSPAASQALMNFNQIVKAVASYCQTSGMPLTSANIQQAAMWVQLLRAGAPTNVVQRLMLLQAQRAAVAAAGGPVDLIDPVKMGLLLSDKELINPAPLVVELAIGPLELLTKSPIEEVWDRMLSPAVLYIYNSLVSSHKIMAEAAAAAVAAAASASAAAGMSAGAAAATAAAAAAAAAATAIPAGSANQEFGRQGRAAGTAGQLQQGSDAVGGGDVNGHTSAVQARAGPVVPPASLAPGQPAAPSADAAPAPPAAPDSATNSGPAPSSASVPGQAPAPQANPAADPNPGRLDGARFSADPSTLSQPPGSQHPFQAPESRPLRATPVACLQAAQGMPLRAPSPAGTFMQYHQHDTSMAVGAHAPGSRETMQQPPGSNQAPGEGQVPGRPVMAPTNPLHGGQQAQACAMLTYNPNPQYTSRFDKASNVIVPVHSALAPKHTVTTGHTGKAMSAEQEAAPAHWGPSSPTRAAAGSFPGFPVLPEPCQQTVLPQSSTDGKDATRQTFNGRQPAAGNASTRVAVQLSSVQARTGLDLSCAGEPAGAELGMAAGMLGAAPGVGLLPHQPSLTAASSLRHQMQQHQQLLHLQQYHLHMQQYQQHQLALQQQQQRALSMQPQQHQQQQHQQQQQQHNLMGPQVLPLYPRPAQHLPQGPPGMNIAVEGMPQSVPSAVVTAGPDSSASAGNTSERPKCSVWRGTGNGNVNTSSTPTMPARHQASVRGAAEAPASAHATSPSAEPAVGTSLIPDHTAAPQRRTAPEGLGPAVQASSINPFAAAAAAGVVDIPAAAPADQVSKPMSAPILVLPAGPAPAPLSAQAPGPAAAAATACTPQPAATTTALIEAPAKAMAVAAETGATVAVQQAAQAVAVAPAPPPAPATANAAVPPAPAQQALNATTAAPAATPAPAAAPVAAGGLVRATAAGQENMNSNVMMAAGAPQQSAAPAATTDGKSLHWKKRMML